MTTTFILNTLQTRMVLYSTKSGSLACNHRGTTLALYQMVLCRTIRGAIEHLNHPREPLKNQTGLKEHIAGKKKIEIYR